MHLNFKVSVNFISFQLILLSGCNYSNIPCFHGTVYCESCIVNQDEQMLRCQVCQSFHPTGFPKVCLDLCNFLDEHFPKECAHRRDAVQLKHVNSEKKKHVNPTARMSTECTVPFYSDVV